MRTHILLFFQLLLLQPVVAQQQPANTYAIIVGISRYENEAIPSLQYAHRDAEAFAGYLRSHAGGNVPEKNLSVLIGEQATTAAVYMAMSNLMQKVQENDVVYFYFAGHGDMENITIYKLGFLLTYNTPPNNYINNSIRMEDVNNFANTLSAGKKAKVVLITDACHSGKLAGSDFRGNLLVGNQLRTATANEIRITSCGPLQVSNESEAWGGGRGVFSFYLVKGLIGFADQVKDGLVRLHEIKTFVDSALQHDPVLKSNNKVQSPVIPVSEAVKEFTLSRVDTVQMNRNVIIVSFAPPLAPADMPVELLMPDLFQFLGTQDLSKFSSLEQLAVADVQELPFLFLDRCIRYFQQKSITKKLSEKQLFQQQIEKATVLMEKMKAAPESVPAFHKELVLLLHTQTQQVINQYLAGSEAELERRRYYNAESSGFETYPLLLQLAMRLTEKDNFLYHAMEVNYLYFSAVARLVQLPLTPNQKPLLDEAFALLQKALAIEKEAAYIYNAIGTVYNYRGDLSHAIKNYVKAAAIAPDWALPYSNLMGVYLYKKDFGKAQQLFEKAQALQPGLQAVYVQAGILEENKKNYLLAEELHQKSIGMNSRHFLPFERLGLVYLTTTDYAKADTFFYEAAQRKKGYFFSPFASSLLAPSYPGIFTRPNLCSFDTTHISSNDVLAYFSWGMQYYRQNDVANAEKKWKQVVALDKKNPLVFHYLGKLYHEQKRMAEAELCFQYAVRYYLDEQALAGYADTLLRTTSDTAQATCFKENFTGARYKRSENHYFLAALYEAWNHFTEAEQQYRLLIQMDPWFIGPYKKLALLLEQLGRYTDAEAVFRSFETVSYEDFTHEMSAFYERVTKEFPADFNWHFRAGQFYHSYTRTVTKVFPEDRMRMFPDSDKPEYLVDEVRVSRSALPPVYLPGTGEPVYMAPELWQPYTLGIAHLLKADSLLGSNDATGADINDKLGDLYRGQGLPTFAAERFQKAVDLQPQNAGVRMKLVHMYDTTYQFTRALQHLDSLKSRGALNVTYTLLLAKYYMHKGDVAAAAVFLTDATKKHPYTGPRIYELYGRLYTLSGQYQQAIEPYQTWLAQEPDAAAVMYSMSRVYAQLKQKKKAWEWLQKALDAGFAYAWVLQFDPLMNELRKSTKWTQLLSKVKMKEYPPPANTYQRLPEAEQ